MPQHKTQGGTCMSGPASRAWQGCLNASIALVGKRAPHQSASGLDLPCRCARCMLDMHVQPCILCLAWLV